MRHRDDAGEPYLAIHEAYTLHDGQEGWTARPVPIEADTVADMYKALHQILCDFDRYGVQDVETGEKVDE